VASECDPSPDFGLEELVLEFLLPENLPALLSPPYQVRHDRVCGTIRKVLVNLEAFIRQLSRDLVGETLKLAHRNTSALIHTQGLDLLTGDLNGVEVV
jgi:hypothetical protein